MDRAFESMLGEHLISQVLNAGYNYDFIDDGAIRKLGVPYPLVVVPNVERMPLATIRKLRDYAANGGVVLATKRAPSIAPGLSEAGDTAEVVRLSKALFDARRMVLDETTLGARLNAAFQPDFAVASAKDAIGFIHRKLDGLDVYFVANSSNRPVHTKAVLRSANAVAQWWNPFAAVDAPVSVALAKDGFALDLEPYESRVLVTAPGMTLTAAPPTATEVTLDPPVRESASVEVNGVNLGSVWHPPFLTDITRALYPGRNKFNLIVGNTAVNGLAGSALPDYKLLTLKYGNRFQPRDMGNLQPLPSGIPGKVMLISK